MGPRSFDRGNGRSHKLQIIKDLLAGFREPASFGLGIGHRTQRLTVKCMQVKVLSRIERSLCFAHHLTARVQRVTKTG